MFNTQPPCLNSVLEETLYYGIVLSVPPAYLNQGGPPGLTFDELKATTYLKAYEYH